MTSALIPGLNTSPTPPTSPIKKPDDQDDPRAFTRWERTADGQLLGASSLRIGGMHCAACAGIVEQALGQVDGVLKAHVSANASCATIQWDPRRTSASALIAAITSAGYSATPDVAADARMLRTREARTSLWRVFVAGFCAMQIMMLATPSYVSAPGDLALDHKRLLDWGGWLLCLPVLCFAATPFLQGAWQALRNQRIGMDVPVALGIAVAFVASSAATFSPGGVLGNEVYFDSLSMFISFLLAGRHLEMRARHRAECALEDAAEALPAMVTRLLSEGRTEQVATRQLQAGDRVRVLAGQACPADGPLEQGHTRVDESMLTGESRPIAKAPGDTVVAGSINLGSPVVMRVERLGPDTRYEEILALTRAARSQRPSLLAPIDRWASPFLWTVLLLAATAGLAWSRIDAARVPWVVVSVLIVTCPCALSLAAPSALLAAAGFMARHGLLIRRLDAIALLPRVTTVFIDKTGTLTEPRAADIQVESLDAGIGAPPCGWGGVAASLATWSSHPLACALVEAFEAPPLEWTDVHEVAGQGLQGCDAQGQVWRLGSAAWTGAAGDATDAGDNHVWLSRGGRPVARLRIEERLRDDAVSAIYAWQARGLKVCILSGDAPRRVERMARLLGLPDAQGGLSPEYKLATLQAARARGEIVAMVGDGINDAPVLAAAHVSIAMGVGASVSRAQADGVLMSNRLSDLALAFGTARKAICVVRQNLAWAALYNLACVPMALAGWLPPWASGLGMAASSLFVVFNAMRLSR